MSIVGGVDIHRKQITFDYVEVETGRLERGRITPADREHLADWLSGSTQPKCSDWRGSTLVWCLANRFIAM